MYKMLNLVPLFKQFHVHQIDLKLHITLQLHMHMANCNAITYCNAIILTACLFPCNYIRQRYIQIYGRNFHFTYCLYSSGQLQIILQNENNHVVEILLKNPPISGGYIVCYSKQTQLYQRKLDYRQPHTQTFQPNCKHYTMQLVGHHKSNVVLFKSAYMLITLSQLFCHIFMSYYTIRSVQS